MSEPGSKGLRVDRTIFGEDGVKKSSSSRTVDSLPYQVIPIGKDLPAPLVRLQLRSGRRLLSENVYWGSLEGRDDVSYLDRLPKVRLVGEFSEGKVSIHNPSKTPALMVHLSLRREDGSRILPEFFFDNYLSVWPGETKTTKVEGADGGLVYVDGWNVTGIEGERIRYDEEAFPESALPALSPRPKMAGVVISLHPSENFDRSSSWAADNEFVCGGDLAAQPGIVTGSDLPQAMLQTERWGEFVYTIPVPDKPCRVRLIFSEGSTKRVGGRKFSFFINRQKVLDEFDIFAEVGADRADEKEFDATPDRNGNVSIAFRKGSADEPEVRAVQVLEN